MPVALVRVILAAVAAGAIYWFARRKPLALGPGHYDSRLDPQHGGHDLPPGHSPDSSTASPSTDSGAGSGEVYVEHGKVYVEGGYDPTAAINIAPTLNVDLQDGRVSDVPLIRAFQAASGLRVDAIYGPETKGALRYWLRASGSQVEPPRAFSGSGEIIYSPADGIARLPDEIPGVDRGNERDHWPTVLSNCEHDAARFYAPLVAQRMTSKAYKKDPDALRALRSFQLASGLIVDGDYGPGAYHALAYWLRSANSPLRPPNPIFRGTTNSYTPCAKVRMARQV